MESTLLSSCPIFTCKETPLNLGLIRQQLGFASVSRQRSSSSKIGSLIIRASIAERNGSSQDGSSTLDKEGLLLGTEKDSSGSVVGFHLIPQSASTLSVALEQVLNLSWIPALYQQNGAFPGMFLLWLFSILTSYILGCFWIREGVEHNISKLFQKSRDLKFDISI